MVLLLKELINLPGPFQKDAVDPYVCYLISSTHFRIVIERVIDLVLRRIFKYNITKQIKHHWKSRDRHRTCVEACVDGTYILNIIIWQQSDSTIFNILYRIQITSREEQNLTAQRSNSNTAWFNFQTYIIFSINLVSQVTLRSSGADIVYGCHLLNQAVLELDLWAVKFCSSLDVIWIHTMSESKHGQLDWCLFRKNSETKRNSFVS
jgi:hypothetical protein